MPVGKNLKKFTITVSDEDAGKRLDQVLASGLQPKVEGPELSKGKIRKLIVSGAVYLNGSRVRIASKEMRRGARIDAYIDFQKLKADRTASDRPFVMTKENVLYEDDDLIAVDKPAGLPTQPTLDEARNNLFAAVKKYLTYVTGSPHPYLGLHHRLDRDTSGVILFTKRESANAGVAELFTGHLAEKTYLALAFAPTDARRELPSNWSIKNYLAKSKKDGKRGLMHSVRSGGDFAHTDFKVLEHLGKFNLIEAKPRTGRTHQIRVHLAEDDMPIFGDLTYCKRDSPPEIKPERMMLHAASLTFRHPILKFEISIRSPIPEDFSKCLQFIRGARKAGL